MANSLILAFRTTDGKTYNIRVNDPRQDVTREQAEAVMNDMISKNVFETSTGATLAEIAAVYSIVTTKSEILV